MMGASHVKVYAVETTENGSNEVKKVAVALSDPLERMAHRMGVSTEKLIAQTCAGAGLTVLRVGNSESLQVSLRAGEPDTDLRDTEDIRCPLRLDPWGTPPLLCAMDVCDCYSTSCYSILAAAEAVLKDYTQ